MGTILNCAWDEKDESEIWPSWLWLEPGKTMVGSIEGGVPASDFRFLLNRSILKSPLPPLEKQLFSLKEFIAQAPVHDSWKSASEIRNKVKRSYPSDRR